MVNLLNKVRNNASGIGFGALRLSTPTIVLGLIVFAIYQMSTGALDSRFGWGLITVSLLPVINTVKDTLWHREVREGRKKQNEKLQVIESKVKTPRKKKVRKIAKKEMK